MIKKDDFNVCTQAFSVDIVITHKSQNLGKIQIGISVTTSLQARQMQQLSPKSENITDSLTDPMTDRDRCQETLMHLKKRVVVCIYHICLQRKMDRLNLRNITLVQLDSPCYNIRENSECFPFQLLSFLTHYFSGFEFNALFTKGCFDENYKTHGRIIFFYGQCVTSPILGPVSLQCNKELCDPWVLGIKENKQTEFHQKFIVRLLFLLEQILRSYKT